MQVSICVFQKLQFIGLFKARMKNHLHVTSSSNIKWDNGNDRNVVIILAVELVKEFFGRQAVIWAWRVKLEAHGTSLTLCFKVAGAVSVSDLMGWRVVYHQAYELLVLLIFFYRIVFVTPSHLYNVFVYVIVIVYVLFTCYVVPSTYRKTCPRMISNFLECAAES